MQTRSRKRAAAEWYDAAFPEEKSPIDKKKRVEKTKEEKPIQQAAAPAPVTPPPDDSSDDSSDDSQEDIDREAFLKERRILIDYKDPINGIYNFTGRDVYVVPDHIMRAGNAYVSYKLNYYPRDPSILGKGLPRCLQETKDSVFPCGTRVKGHSPLTVENLPAGLPRILVEESVADDLRILGYDGEVYTTDHYAEGTWKETHRGQTILWPSEGLVRVSTPSRTGK